MISIELDNVVKEENGLMSVYVKILRNGHLVRNITVQGKTEKDIKIELRKKIEPLKQQEDYQSNLRTIAQKAIDEVKTELLLG